MSAPKVEVVVALSGGVDSAMAAALLVGQGWQVQGVHLWLGDRLMGEAESTAVAERLQIPLTVLDLRQEFARHVVEYFISTYAQGYTPNPCVQCNAAVKFAQLWKTAKDLGATHLATGHYARLAKGGDGSFRILRGQDKSKDQSYFLCRLPRQLLPHLLLPLGELTKSEVQRQAQNLGLSPLALRQESQEVCFIKGRCYAEFLADWPGWRRVPGEVVNRRGQVLGAHRGLGGYTVGQRRGLGLPAREPYYVLEIQPEANRLVVGHRDELLAAGLLATRMNWLIDPPPGPLEAQAVIRYRHRGVLARLEPLGQSELRVTFATPQAAVAPGQAVAFYQDDHLLGGAWIERSL